MKVCEPPKLKAFDRINRVADSMLRSRLEVDTENAWIIDQRLRDRLQTVVLPLAQKTILNSLEGRQEQEEDLFGFDWEDAMPQIIPQQKHRMQAVKMVLGSHPHIHQMLDHPVVKERDHIEWLYENTVGRIQKFTPYLLREEEALTEWQAAYAHVEPAKNPYVQADYTYTLPSSVRTQSKGQE